MVCSASTHIILDSVAQVLILSLVSSQALVIPKLSFWFSKATNLFQILNIASLT